MKTKTNTKSSLKVLSKTGRAPRKAKHGFPAYTGTAASVVSMLRPEHPLYILRPQIASAVAAQYVKLFPGKIMYAVKCNPDPAVLRLFWQSGVRMFDVASLEEVKHTLSVLPNAHLCFMHPVKSRRAIRETYYEHGVRTFVLDSADELAKILEETDNAIDLTLFIRLALPYNKCAATDFSSKFGAEPAAASALLAAARPHCQRLGLAFHPGTQNMNPDSLSTGVNISADVIRGSGVKVDVLDTGGGFPVPYADMAPAPLSTYMNAISAAVKDAGLGDIELYCEPGRGLAAECTSLVVQVGMRRGDTLYINDGTYCGLFEAGPLMNLRYPVKLIRPTGHQPSDTLHPFRLAGPTCDSLDMMKGPFELPEDTREGDWIEILNTGAYSAGQRCPFNGFGHSDTVVLYEKE